MYISSTKPSFAPLSRARVPAAPQAVPQEDQKDVRVPFKEHAVTGAIVGASLGTIAGEKLGELSTISGIAYAGYAIGSTLGYGDLGSVVGAVTGATAGFFLEKKFPIGKTVGGAAGFVSGGIVGGITGSVIGGASMILNADLFKKS